MGTKEEKNRQMREGCYGVAISYAGLAFIVIVGLVAFIQMQEARLQQYRNKEAEKTTEAVEPVDKAPEKPAAKAVTKDQAPEVPEKEEAPKVGEDVEKPPEKGD